MFELGYEVILPTSGKRALVRGLTLKEELDIQKTSLIEEEDIIVKTLRLAEIAYTCINNKDLFENDFGNFLNQITDTDLNSIVFGIIYNTYGKDLPILYTCTKKDLKPDTTNFSENDLEEIKRGTLTGKVDLDKVKLDGKVNIEGKVIDIKEVSVSDKITVTYAPFPFMSDSISALAYLKTAGISNAADAQKVPKESMSQISFSSRVSTVRTIKVEGKTKLRPLHYPVENVADWYNSLFDMCQDLPAKDMKKIKLQSNPYTVTFKVPVVCKVCKQKHPIAIDCLQRLVDLATE
jgi:hypothetical protein